MAGWPAHATGILVSRLPAALVDPVARLQRRLTIPDLTPYGIPQPQDGLLTRVRRIGEVPLQDVGFVGAVRSGTVTPVAAVTGFEGDKVLLADGSAISPQAVIAATGYRRGLEKIVGHLGSTRRKWHAPGPRRAARGSRPVLPWVHRLAPGHAARYRGRRTAGRVRGGTRLPFGAALVPGSADAPRREHDPRSVAVTTWSPVRYCATRQCMME